MDEKKLEEKLQTIVQRFNLCNVLYNDALHCWKEAETDEDRQYEDFKIEKYTAKMNTYKAVLRIFDVCWEDCEDGSIKIA